MAVVIYRALSSFTREPSEPLLLKLEFGRVELTCDELKDILVTVRARGLTYAAARRMFRANLIRAFQNRYAAQLTRRERSSSFDTPETRNEVESNPDFAKLVSRTFPPIRAETVVRQLLTDETALHAASAGDLRADEQKLLIRKAARRISDEK